MGTDSPAGKTALITGASKGLGKARAKALTGAGAHVVLVSRDRAKLERVAQKLPGKGSVLVADVMVEKEVARLAEGVHPAHEMAGLRADWRIDVRRTRDTKNLSTAASGRELSGYHQGEELTFQRELLDPWALYSG